MGVAPASAIFMAVYTPVKQYIQQEVGHRDCKKPEQLLSLILWTGGSSAGLA